MVERSPTLLRGRLLWFTREPQARDDGSHHYIADGALVINGAQIADIGGYLEVRQRHPDATEIDHRPHLIMPGFIDTHLHFPQTQVIGSWGTQLLDWLNTYTFPEEGKYADPAHCAVMAERFLDLLAAHGTTTAVAYCSAHRCSADALFAAAANRRMAMIAGKVMMDRNAPASVLDTAQSGYDDSKAIIEAWHGKGRNRVAVTPRFAITSTPAQLEAAGALLGEYPDCYMQTHLSENDAEIVYTAELYPEAKDYLDVYEQRGLLGHKSLFGHAIHLTAREVAAMADTGSVAVFCPTSNLFLGSGLYDEAGLHQAGVRRAIATDIGGGTNYSLLRTLDEGYKVLQLRGQNLHPLKSFYWITLGNARALSLEPEIGTLETGTAADLVVLDAAATPAMANRMETIETLAEELFLLQTLGDDRSIAATYIAGTRQAPATP